MKNTLAYILGGGQGSRLMPLTEHHAKPAIRFGAHHRIIDFPLSNLLNSGISQARVVVQYKSQSLRKHVEKWSRDWGSFPHQRLGYNQPIHAATPTSYQGTADAITQNLNEIKFAEPDNVLILGGDHIYKMDYSEKIEEHKKNNSHLTITAIPVPIEEAAGNFGVILTDAQGNVTGFEEKPKHPTEMPGKPGYTLASMGNYVFDTETLIRELEEDDKNPNSNHDFGNNIIPKMLKEGKKIKVYDVSKNSQAEDGQFYWRDVGNNHQFYEANMDQVATTPELNMYDKKWPIHTYVESVVPAKTTFDTQVLECIVGNESVISKAYAKQSVLGSETRLNSGSRVVKSVLLGETDIGRGADIYRTIIDRHVRIPEGMRIGHDVNADLEKGLWVFDNTLQITPKMITEGYQPQNEPITIVPRFHKF